MYASIRKLAPKLLLFGLGRISNFWLLLSLAEELSFRWCCLSFMWSSSDLSTQAAHLIWAASLPYCTGCCTSTTCQNICVLSKYLQAHIFSPFPRENQKPISDYKCPINSLQIHTWSKKLSKSSCNTFESLNRGRPCFWPRTLKTVQIQQWGVRWYVVCVCFKGWLLCR